jgi:hypothetical protein
MRGTISRLTLGSAALLVWLRLLIFTRELQLSLAEFIRGRSRPSSITESTQVIFGVGSFSPGQYVASITELPMCFPQIPALHHGAGSLQFTFLLSHTSQNPATLSLRSEDLAFKLLCEPLAECCVLFVASQKVTH